MMCNAQHYYYPCIFTLFIETRVEIVGEWTSPENIVHCSENRTITDPEMCRCLLLSYFLFLLTLLKNEIWSLSTLCYLLFFYL